MITFTIPGVPTAMPRQRHRIVNKGASSFVMNYTPSRAPVQTYKATIQLMASQAMAGHGLFAGPVAMCCEFIFPRPQRLMTKKASAFRLPHTSRPDADNVLKAVKDALKGIVWNDDSQVMQLTVTKLYCAKDGEVPHTLVEVWRFGYPQLEEETHE